LLISEIVVDIVKSEWSTLSLDQYQSHKRLYQVKRLFLAT
jgi:hypothetical protein